jgi:hypothetical protein
VRAGAFDVELPRGDARPRAEFAITSTISRSRSRQAVPVSECDRAPAARCG